MYHSFMTDAVEWNFEAKFQLLAEKLALEDTEVSFLNAFAQLMAKSNGVGDLQDLRMQFTAATGLGYNTADRLVEILENSGLENVVRFAAIKANLLASGEPIFEGSPPLDAETSDDWFQSDFDHDEAQFNNMVSADVARRLVNQLRAARSKDAEITQELALRNQRRRRLNR